MFTKLQSVVDQYNEHKQMKGRRAMLQWYETTGNNDNNEDDSDTEHPPKKKWKNAYIHLSHKSLIIVIIPVMARACTFSDSTS